MPKLIKDLTDKSTGTYFDKVRWEYVLVIGGKIMGGYRPSGQEERDREIDRMMWRRVLSQLPEKNQFNITHKVKFMC